MLAGACGSRSCCRYDERRVDWTNTQYHSMSPKRCRRCGATSYRHVIERDEGGRLTKGRLKQCSGCSEVFAETAAWRGDGEGQKGLAATAVPPASPSVRRDNKPQGPASDWGRPVGCTRKRASPWWCLAHPEPCSGSHIGDAVMHSKVSSLAHPMASSVTKVVGEWSVADRSRSQHDC